MKSNNTSAKLANVYRDRNRLWGVLRCIHVLLTGLPDPGTAMKNTTPLKLLVADIVWLTAFTLLSAGGVAAAGLGGWAIALGTVLVLVGMLGAVGRLRRLIVGHVHEASHPVVAKFYRKRGDAKKLARWKAEFILDFGTVLTFTQNGQSYRREHARHHTFAKLGTVRDPDGRMLHDWGVWPTKTDNLYRTLLSRIFNPLWHFDVLRRRLQSNLMEGKLYRRVLGALSLTALLGSAFVLPLPIWIVAIFLPFGPLLHVASLLQVITEHPYGGRKPASDLEAYAALTWERIPWTPMPAPGATPQAWAKWTGLLFIHIASRLAVLDDTMIGHSYHHLAWPTGKPFLDWYNTMAHYTKAVAEGTLPDGIDDRIVEGLIGALVRQQAYFKSQRE